MKIFILKNLILLLYNLSQFFTKTKTEKKEQKKIRKKTKL